MIFKPELFTQQQVLQWYDSRENSCFIIFTGVKCDAKNVFCKWINEDGNEGHARLEKDLTFITENVSNSNTYTILSFPFEEGCESWKVKDLEGETIRFQFHVSNYSIGSVGNNPQPQLIDNKPDIYAKELFTMMQKQNEMIFQRFAFIEAKLNEQDDIEEEEEEYEEEPPPPPTGKERLLGALAGIIERPEFTETIMTVGAALIGKLFDTNKNNENGSV